ncbi:response regulator [Lyngbya sp. PCC 8106]|uniref:response regulator n=1 Tax=Lyngbya sp. (strain PCC 8106) TaxID=313612 RepID=UPI0000EAD0C2|nr:response regulator [Lyngbya sp. PCC 8106]EAW38207.1 two-component response regulator [Lyngbya sp. PCC 8106]
MTTIPAKISASSKSVSSPKVLIVEDEYYARQLFVNSLEAEGFCPIEAENGVIGLELARKYLPEVIICDIIMPELDGYGVLNSLRECPETAIIPFIFVTGKWEKDNIRQAMVLGADDYITKPFKIQDLIEAVVSQIKKRSILQEGYALKFNNTPTNTPTSSESQDGEESDEINLEETTAFNCPFEESLNKVFNFIEANYWRSITLAEVAEYAGYSPAYLTSQVGSLTGKTVNRWIIERRMKAARSLLQETSYTVEQIARRIGYQSSCHFSRQFRKHHGAAPQIWRNQQTNSDQ